MSQIGLFYGSTTGNTENAANRILAELGPEDVMPHNVAESLPGDLLAYDFMILGTSTWGNGELQDDWAVFDLGGVDLTGKIVALFGLGDQEGYPGTFVDGMGILYRKIIDSGGTVVGAVARTGYACGKSFAVVDGVFVGLPLDDDNQPELTDERISKWVAHLKQFM